jgi:hypothetical protein
MQPEEGPQEIFIIVDDETYPPQDEEHWEKESEAFRVALEKRFGARFQEVNIGPGADIPAFLTVVATTEVPLWSTLIAAFFFGKSINENLEAWRDIASKIRSLFTTRTTLNRNGAGVLAVEAVFEEMQGIPRTLKQLSYRTGLVLDSDDFEEMPEAREIEQSPPTINLGLVRHIFEIEADGQKFRVSVDRAKTRILRL